jgi:uncharacterized protein involved in exopolysaccharide biosynthesis
MMAINPNAPVLIITVVFIWSGGYLILRPSAYKSELRAYGDHVISRFPSWAVRILGIFIIVFALGVTYLALKTGK